MVSNIDLLAMNLLLVEEGNHHNLLSISNKDGVGRVLQWEAISHQTKQA